MKDMANNTHQFDLSDALKDVRPLVETEIDQVAPFMHARRHTSTDELPDEISFYVPNIDQPTDIATLKYDRVRYVHLDSMPPELFDVVRAYLSTRRNTRIDKPNQFHLENLKKTVKILAEKVETIGFDTTSEINDIETKTKLPEPQNRQVREGMQPHTKAWLLSEIAEIRDMLKALPASGRGALLRVRLQRLEDELLIIATEPQVS